MISRSIVTDLYQLVWSSVLPSESLYFVFLSKFPLRRFNEEDKSFNSTEFCSFDERFVFPCFIWLGRR